MTKREELKEGAVEDGGHSFEGRTVKFIIKVKRNKNVVYQGRGGKEWKQEVILRLVVY